MTISFYDAHGHDFFDRTVNIDLNHLYDTYVKYLPEHAHILDAGCGSGRDSKAFLERGYRVTAFDASETLVELARNYTGLDVQQMTFEDITYQSQFDGVWANASLLHIPYKDLPSIFEKMIATLKKNGMFYASFKIGRGERIVEDGRHFTFFDEAHMRDFVAQIPNLLIEEIVITADARGNRPDWLNVFMRKIT